MTEQNIVRTKMTYARIKHGKLEAYAECLSAFEARKSLMTSEHKDAVLVIVVGFQTEEQIDKHIRDLCTTGGV
jgi:hypothetical protein